MNEKKMGGKCWKDREKGGKDDEGKEGKREGRDEMRNKERRWKENNARKKTRKLINKEMKRAER